MRSLSMLAFFIGAMVLGACQLMTRPSPAAVSLPTDTPLAGTPAAVAVPSTAVTAALAPTSTPAEVSSDGVQSQAADASSITTECWVTNTSSAALPIYREPEQINVYTELAPNSRVWVTQVVRNQNNPQQIDWLTTRLPGGGTGYLAAAGVSFDPACDSLLAAPPPPVECVAFNIAGAAADIYKDTNHTQIAAQLAPNESIIVTQALINAQDPMTVDWFVVQLANGESGYLVPNGLSLSDSCSEIVPIG